MAIIAKQTQPSSGAIALSQQFDLLKKEIEQTTNTDSSLPQAALRKIIPMVQKIQAQTLHLFNHDCKTEIRDVLERQGLVNNKNFEEIDPKFMRLALTSVRDVLDRQEVFENVFLETYITHSFSLSSEDVRMAILQLNMTFLKRSDEAKEIASPTVGRLRSTSASSYSPLLSKKQELLSNISKLGDSLGKNMTTLKNKARSFSFKKDSSSDNDEYSEDTSFPHTSDGFTGAISLPTLWSSTNQNIPPTPLSSSPEQNTTSPDTLRRIPPFKPIPLPPKAKVISATPSQNEPFSEDLLKSFKLELLNAIKQTSLYQQAVSKYPPLEIDMALNEVNDKMFQEVLEKDLLLLTTTPLPDKISSIKELLMLCVVYRNQTFIYDFYAKNLSLVSSDKEMDSKTQTMIDVIFPLINLKPLANQAIAIIEKANLKNIRLREKELYAAYYLYRKSKKRSFKTVESLKKELTDYLAKGKGPNPFQHLILLDPAFNDEMISFMQS
ncbi:MAG: hypothetical protein ACM3JI_01150 [Anaerolineae bacterium]